MQKQCDDDNLNEGNNDSISKSGWDVKIKSKHEAEFSIELLLSEKDIFVLEFLTSFQSYQQKVSKLSWDWLGDL